MPQISWGTLQSYGQILRLVNRFLVEQVDFYWESLVSRQSSVSKLIVTAGTNKMANQLIFETLTLSKSVYFIRKETIRENKLDNVTKNLFVSVKC